MLQYIGCATHTLALPAGAARTTQTMVMMEHGSDELHLLQQNDTGEQHQQGPDPTDLAMRLLGDDARKQVVKTYWLDACNDGVPTGTEHFYAWAVAHDLKHHLLQNPQFVRADAHTTQPAEAGLHGTVDEALRHLRGVLDSWARGSVYPLTPSDADVTDPEFLERWEFRCDADGTRFPGWSTRLRVLTDGAEVFARAHQPSVTLM